MEAAEIILCADRPKVTLSAYPVHTSAGDKPRPAVIVLPGGAYIAHSDNEGAPVAERLSQMGYGVFLLKYSTLFDDFSLRKGFQDANPDVLFPGPLLDLGRAVLYIKAHAGEYGVDPERIILCGFSAGAHLAACFGAGWDSDEIAPALGVEREALRVHAMILSYPPSVIKTQPNSSKKQLFIERMLNMAVFGRFKPSQEELDKRSPALHVTSNMPPAFIWHTAQDDLLGPENSMILAEAYFKAGVECELHIFPHGLHSLGLAEGNTAGQWVGLADTWLKNIR